MSFFPSSRPLLPDIFALHEKWRAEKPAACCDGKTLTWRELGEAGNRVANGLLAQGLKPGDMVAVLMENSLETLETLIGIMKAGCVSVPLNLTVPDDAIAAMISDAGAKAMIASETQCVRAAKILERIGQPAPPTLVTLGKAPTNWLSYDLWKQAQPSTRPDITISPGDSLNIIYSSGTTGTPKGILHTHQTRLDWAYALSIALRYHGGAQTLCTLGLYSNVSWVMILCTLIAGGTLHIFRKFDAGNTLDAIERRGITHIAMVPVQFRRLLDHESFAPKRVSSMQAMMSCGSPLHADLKQRIFDGFSSGIIELYGLTEGVITTLDPEDANGRLSSVGKPVIGTDIKLIGKDDREVGTGMPGEIVATGSIVMPGYHNRPDATREAQWQDRDGKMWLRTGDVGKLDADGFLYIVDRKKDMILSGGQNIYPADIEAVLVQHEDVRDAAVIGIPHPEWGETPLAVVERHDSATCSEMDMMAWLNERVGRHQRVSGVVFVDELPRNANGKVLKRTLRDKLANP